MNERPCKSCGAMIADVRTPAGKWMPVDLASKEKRVVIIGSPSEPPGEIVGLAHMLDTYVSHFATCPNAASHRRG